MILKTTKENIEVNAFMQELENALKTNELTNSKNTYTTIFDEVLKVENEVRKHINDNSVKILYRVTVKYKDTNKIPIGLLIEAQSIDDNYSICRFCYNIQKGKKIRYSDGMIVGEKQI